MSCQEFEDGLLDLMADGAENESLHASALRHASHCARCGARLANHRNLAQGLRALAEAMNVEKAPDRVEQALMREFRKGIALNGSAPAVNTRRAVLWKTSAWGGLAASVLLLVGWALVHLNRESEIHKAQTVPSPKPATNSGAKPVDPAPKAKPEKSSEIVPKATRPGKTPPSRPSKPVAERRVEYAARPSRMSERSPLQTESAVADVIETEFLPFMPAGPRFPSEQRQFVRVKLPRSALQVFGLPMNMERAREPVQADVLLGEDGRALAVRFVRD